MKNGSIRDTPPHTAQPLHTDFIKSLRSIIFTPTAPKFLYLYPVENTAAIVLHIAPPCPIMRQSAHYLFPPERRCDTNALMSSNHNDTNHLAPIELPYKVPDSTLPYLQERFVQEYVLSGNVRKAYVAAFGEAASAKPERAGRDLLRNPSVMARLHVHQHAVATMSVKSTEALVRELEEMVDADINEFITVKTGACRYCHGVGGLYLWRDMAEYEAAVHKAVELRKPTPELGGGVGYRFDAGPNPNCPQCEGEGIQRVFVRETEDVSPGARKLFKGIECYPDGSIKKILLADQLAARQELHRIRGMHIERSLSVNASVALPNAKDIAASPEKAMDFLEGLKQ